MDKPKQFVDNMGLIYNMVNKLAPQQHKEQATQEGSIGLWKACQTFEDKSTAKFSTYATVCVRNAIIDYLRKNVKQTETLAYRPSMSYFSDEGKSPASLLTQYEMNQKIRQAVGKLTSREGAVLSERLLTAEPKTTLALAKEWGCSHQSILRDEQRIKNKIKEGYTYE